MSPVDIEALAKCLAPLVADQIVAQLGLTPTSPASAEVSVLRHRLTLEEFAFCIERTPEVVRRKIRSKRIPKEWVHGPPYHLHPKALSLFAVTAEIAQERLALLARTRAKQPQTQPVTDQPSPV